MEQLRETKKWGCWFKAALVSLAIITPVGLIASSKIHTNKYGLLLVGDNLKSPDWIVRPDDLTQSMNGVNVVEGIVWQIQENKYENLCNKGEKTRRVFSTPTRFGYVIIDGQLPQPIFRTNIGTTMYTDDCDAVRKS